MQETSLPLASAQGLGCRDGLRLLKFWAQDYVGSEVVLDRLRSSN